MHQSKVVKWGMAILCILLVATIMSLMIIKAGLKMVVQEQTAVVPHNTISAASVIYRNSPKATVRSAAVSSLQISKSIVPFNVSNMLPGDSRTNEYIIKAKYKSNITIHFHPEITSDKANMAEVMYLKLLADGTELYNGFLSEVPESIGYYLNGKGQQNETIRYEMIVAMDPAAGNAYKNQVLKADFCWWTENEDGNGTITVISPDTGAVLSSNVRVYFALAVIIIGGTIWLRFLAVRRRRKDQ